MAQKLLKAKTTKIAPRKDASVESSVVLVGTYRDRQLAWIRENGVYNYPVKDGDELTDEACGKVRELWLYADAKSTRHAFAAQFVGKMTREEYVAAHPTYAELGKSKNNAYYVFKATPLDYGPAADGQLVVVRAADFEKGRGRTRLVKKAVERFKADGEFAPLAAYLPEDLAQVPTRQLRVCEAAVQLVFSSLLISKVVAPVSRIEPDCVPSCRSSRVAMSLFSGAGGLDIGVLQAGFDVLSCVELDHNACDTLRRAISTEHRNTIVR